MSHIYGHDRVYQTLVYPDHVVDGVRGLERMDIIKPLLPDHCDVAEFGCNSGMDGVLGVVRGYVGSYWGVDLDKPSVELGRSVVKAWGVEATLVHGDLADVTPPKADVLFLFSIAQRISIDVILDKAGVVSPSLVFVESHPGQDDATKTLLGQLGGSRSEIGTVPASWNNSAPRHLYKVKL